MGTYKMILERVLPYVKTLLQSCVTEGDRVIDATAGNGHDTYFLADLVKPTGHVYSFDIQQSAINATRERLGNLNQQVTLIQSGHEQVKNFVSDEIAAAVFNLGYLPGSDHNIITRPDTTIQAIDGCLDLLKIG